MNKKYILTDQTKTFAGRTLHRIQAVRDFDEAKAGEYGGWVETEENLSQNGQCWISDEAMVFDNARVSGNALVAEHAIACDDAIITGNALLDDYCTVYDKTLIDGEAEIVGSVKVFGNASKERNAS